MSHNWKNDPEALLHLDDMLRAAYGDDYCGYWLDEDEENRELLEGLDREGLVHGIEVCTQKIAEGEMQNKYVIQPVEDWNNGNYLRMDWDAVTVDVLVQYALFGDILYI